MFPTEVKATYYVPYNRIGKKKLLARGKLNVRYHHFREILLSSGATQNRKGKKRKAVDESVAVRIGIADEIFSFGNIFVFLSIVFD